VRQPSTFDHLWGTVTVSVQRRNARRWERAPPATGQSSRTASRSKSGQNRCQHGQCTTLCAPRKFLMGMWENGEFLAISKGNPRVQVRAHVTRGHREATVRAPKCLRPKAKSTVVEGDGLRPVRSMTFKLGRFTALQWRVTTETRKTTVSPIGPQSRGMCASSTLPCRARPIRRRQCTAS